VQLQVSSRAEQLPFVAAEVALQIEAGLAVQKQVSVELGFLASTLRSQL
jgi:hypothetical protein